MRGNVVNLRGKRCVKKRQEGVQKREEGVERGRK